MRLTEINDIILGNVELPEPSNFSNLPDIYEDIKEFIKLGDGLYDKNHLTMTKSYLEFYEANPLFSCFIDDEYKGSMSIKKFKKELFYSMICGCYIPEVPTELLAMFILTRKQTDSPNKMIKLCDASVLKRYINTKFHSNKYIIKELLDTIWGYEVELITKYKPCVTNGNITEVYISNINDVMLCDNSIKDIIVSNDDYSKLWYSSEKGVVLGEEEIPVRTMIHYLGITEDDLDLRGVGVGL